MTKTFVELTCPRCGGELEYKGDGLFVCEHCERRWERESIDDYERIFEKFDIALREQRREDLAALARIRYAETRKEYVSNIELERICKKILDLNPDDFYAQFYLATCKEDYTLENFLYAMDIKKHYYDVEQMVEYLIRGLQARWINAVSTLIENAYKSNDIGKYHYYRTKFEEMADNVDSGMFEPTLPRDVFIAYSSRDMDKVNELLHVLEDENGLSCFVAARNLRHGGGAVEIYREAINTAMCNCNVVVFVSSVSSRDGKCEVLREINYIKDNLQKMGRIELLIENYKGIAIERIFKRFFNGLEYCTAPQEVAERYVDKYMFDEEYVDVEMSGELKAEAERIAKLQAEAEEAAKRNEETEATLKEEAEKIAKQRAEIVKGAKHNAEKEAALKAESERIAKLQPKVEEAEKRNAEKEVELKNESERIAKLQKKVEEAAKCNAELETVLNEEIERIAKLYTELETKRNEAKRKAESAVEAMRKTDAKYNMEDIKHYSEEKIMKSIEADFEIENGMLKKYRGDAENVVIPSSVTSIDAFAFRHYSKLTNITIPSSVTSIGSGAFANCTSLTKITIPVSVNYIGLNALSYCNNIKTIYCEATQQPLGWSKQWLGNCSAKVIWNYRKTEEKQQFETGNIIHTQSTVVTNSASQLSDFEIENGVLKLYKGNAKNIVIPNGVTSIAEFAFNECRGLTDVHINTGITSIEKWAFAYCSNLKSINIPNSVTYVSYNVFSGCRNLEKIYCESNNKPIKWNNAWLGNCKAQVIWGYKG